ncbi:uncharacterized protein BDZ99DRAFT_571644 [Mytilinidion resinicola]|uniref:Uncharacterized protein n=1 Tax=Mytilinidion resinicola TaxID=574789 RepID=A0A6A6YJL8_9PEZI|nr:uncharacterized protein BDZ99DRAFT_571644 [Mytilinidion resinicola]KAF2808748.1 hypothetical protein BDZ99DRAFT_571644 [Mytilinidion resinicola]
MSDLPWKFSGAGDPNKPELLSKALKNIHPGRPATWGGIFQSERADENRIYNEFKTHTIPDIPNNTRVVAVLGISPLGIANPGKRDVDAWMLSDFFAFWNVLHGLTKDQTWLHCLDLQKLVEKHTQFLHGNPYKNDRKVVLDSQILKNATSASELHPPKSVEPKLLKASFEKALRKEALAAQKANQPLLILIFTHGILTQGVNIGISEEQRARLINMAPVPLQLGHNKELDERHFTIVDFRNALKNIMIDITLITNACYSGGWACNMSRAGGITALTAAGPRGRSKAWRYSESLGRACGSMFASAVIEKLTRHPVTEKPLVNDENEDALTEEQFETYQAFTRSTYQLLLNEIDRRGYEHGFVFTAQDDDWEETWGKRTGIPMADFKNRWDSLETWPKDQYLHPGGPQNRDPNVSEELRQEYLSLEAEEAAQQFRDKKKPPRTPFEPSGGLLGKRKASSQYGGSTEALCTTVKELSIRYLKGHPHIEDSPEGGYHAVLRDIINGDENDLKTLEAAREFLQFRYQQMEAADRYVEMMALNKPYDQTCVDFDPHNLQFKVQHHCSEFWDIICARLNALFPPPHSRSQGRNFSKPILYLIAVFAFNKLSPEEAKFAIEKVANSATEEVEALKEVVKTDPEVRSKRRKMMEIFKVPLGAISPNKRSRANTLEEKKPDQKSSHSRGHSFDSGGHSRGESSGGGKKNLQSE